MRYFMRLQYNGAPFNGWQRQPQGVTVQALLEEALSTLMRQPVAITGAGRTDTGVNARLMVAHFDVDQPLCEAASIVDRLNAMVGRDIAVLSICPVAPDAHARFDATARTYRYFVTHRKTPFFNTLAWQCRRRLDYEAMNRAASILLDVSDFTSFAKLHGNARTNICDVSRAVWTAVPGIDGATGDTYMFEITADRFLRNMVRAVVGTLVEVGRGKMTVEEFKRVVEAHDRCAAGTSMPGHALYLWDIRYPYPIVAGGEYVAQ